MFESLLGPLRRTEFLTGATFGGLALALGALAGLLWRRLGRGPVPLAGLLLAGAGALGLRAALTLPSDLVVGLAALGAAGLLWESGRIVGPLELVLAVPGAWIVAGTDVVSAGWRPALCGAIVAGGWLAGDFDRRRRDRALAPGLLALTAVGIYYTVPDTEQALVLLGVATATAPLGWPVRLAGLGRAGALTATGLVVWTAAAGGVGRRSAIVGALVCFGVLLIEPLFSALWRRRTIAADRLRSPWSDVALVGVHLLIVFFGSRVVGLRPEVGGAAALAVAGLVVTLGVLAVTSRADAG